MSEKEKIPKIKDGIVIDHLKAGTALIVVKNVLDIGHGNESIMLGIRFKSQKLGHKDIIKIENKTLTKEELNKIALISPKATINIIENYAVKNKFKVIIPDIVKGILKCPYENCITNHENVPTIFKTLNKSIPKLKCHYCERTIDKNYISLL